MNNLSNLPSLRFSCPSTLEDHEIFLLMSSLLCLALLPCLLPSGPNRSLLSPLPALLSPADPASLCLPPSCPFPGNGPLAGQQVPLQGTCPLRAGFEGAPCVCICFICGRSPGFRDTRAQLSQFWGQAVLLPSTLTLCQWKGHFLRHGRLRARSLPRILSPLPVYVLSTFL